jgi:hypothetical protein
LAAQLEAIAQEAERQLAEENTAKVNEESRE